jgi:hypothetical protein
MERGMRIVNRVQIFLYIRESYEQLKVEFVIDQMAYIILRGCWFHVIVLNIYAPTEEEGSCEHHNEI